MGAAAAPGGRIAFSEAVWLTESPAPRARALFAEYPAMTHLAGVKGWIAAAGLRPLGDFLLSREAWEAYYLPLAERLGALEAAHGADHPVLAEHREEIAVWREHGADYGYGFFVAG